jgi:hypothetical protein
MIELKLPTEGISFNYSNGKYTFLVYCPDCYTVQEGKTLCNLYFRLEREKNRLAHKDVNQQNTMYQLVHAMIHHNSEDYYIEFIDLSPTIECKIHTRQHNHISTQTYKVRKNPIDKRSCLSKLFCKQRNKQ